MSKISSKSRQIKSRRAHFHTFPSTLACPYFKELRDTSTFYKASWRYWRIMF